LHDFDAVVLVAAEEAVDNEDFVGK